MKTNSVATVNAGKIIIAFPFSGKWGTAIVIIMTFLVISCSNNDDLEAIGKESPNPIENPDNDDDESPTNENSLIVYTDIEPDFTGQNLNRCFELNLNNDEIVDFFICPGKDAGWEWLKIDSNSYTKNGIFSVAPWYSQALPLKTNEKIHNLVGYRNGEFYPDMSLISIGYCFGGGTDCSYNWANKGDRFMGLRFFIDGKTHYGWAQLEIVNATQWVVKDYAYNATPDKQIFAGQKE